MDLPSILIILTGLVLGGFVKGLTGMGAPLISIPIIASVLGLPEAIGLLTISYLVSNLYQMVTHARQGWTGQKYLPGFLACGITGVALGTAFVVQAPVELASLILGLLLVVYCITRLARRNRLSLAPALSHRIAPVIGLAAGLLHGATGISSPIGGVFLQAMDMTRSQYLLALSTMFFLFSLTQGLGLFASGTIDTPVLFYGSLALLPVLGGMFVGNLLAERMSPDLFDTALTVLLTALGIKLFVDGATGLFAM